MYYLHTIEPVTKIELVKLIERQCLIVLGYFHRTLIVQYGRPVPWIHLNFLWMRWGRAETSTWVEKKGRSIYDSLFEAPPSLTWLAGESGRGRRRMLGGRFAFFLVVINCPRWFLITCLITWQSRLVITMSLARDNTVWLGDSCLICC